MGALQAMILDRRDQSLFAEQEYAALDVGVSGFAKRLLSDTKLVNAHIAEAYVNAGAARRKRRRQPRLAQDLNDSRVPHVDRYAAEENLLRPPVHRDVARFEPDPLIVSNAQVIRSKRAQPGTADAIDPQVPEPPDALAIREVVHDPRRRRSKRHRHTAGKRRGPRDKRNAMPPWTFRRHQNACPTLI